MNKKNNIKFKPITLSDLLLSKEQRALYQKKLIDLYQLPIISLTINMPGEIKLNDDVLFLFNQALISILSYCKQKKINCLYHNERILNTGPEGFFVIDYPEMLLKDACVKIEMNQKLGRLWDIDVLSVKNYASISRKELGYNARPCLVCNDDAKNCARSKKHTHNELVKAMSEIIIK